jgi:hypothetical protein
MGNVYFAAFVSMHARIRDAGIAHLLGAGKPGAAGAAAARGHFKFVTCWCNFCGDAFPGDTLTIEVSEPARRSCLQLHCRQCHGSAYCRKQSQTTGALRSLRSLRSLLQIRQSSLLPHCRLAKHANII